MARIRSIKPEFCTSAAIADLSLPCELHFAKLWTYCDDEGRALDNARLIKAAIWPLRDEIGFDDVEKWQTELEKKGRIVRYERDGKHLFQVVNWSEHQRPQHPKKSLYPAPSRKEHEANSNPHEASPKPTPVVVVVEGEGEVEKHTSPALRDDADFPKFWNQYPKRNGKRIGKGKAESVWRRLSKTKRGFALVAVAHYASACDSGLTLAKDAFRWLRDETFLDWQTPASTNGQPPTDKPNASSRLPVYRPKVVPLSERDREAGRKFFDELQQSRLGEQVGS